MTDTELPRFERPVKLLAVLACAERPVTEALLEGAQAVCDAANARLEVIEMPSAEALPTAIGMAGRMADFDGFLALGQEASPERRHALSVLGLQGLCIGSGFTPLLAEARETGAQAARAALHLVALSRKWARSGKGMGFLPEGSFRIAETEGPTRA